MRCSSCNSENPETAKFCGSCGAPLEAVCPNCGAENPPQFKFCGECGTPLRKPRRSPEPARPRGSPLAQNILRDESGAGAERAEGERKTVSALFADIKGSTELMRDLDPEEARAIVDPALKLMIDAAHRYDGYVVQSTGDGIFALFGAPVAHEDHPQRALHAALAMQHELRDYAQRLAAEAEHRLKPVPLEVRIGINTGEVVLRMIHTGGHTEYTPVGHAANLAARMQGAAPAGGIVISEDTRRLVEGYFELRDLGPTEVKGISGPINVYEVVGAGSVRGHFELAARRGLTKFVGRESELKQMVHALELTRGGHGQVVAVVAEAGTGKSRLFYEFKATMPAECKVLEAYSVSHGKASAWLPVLELLYRYFGIDEADGKSERRAKIDARLSGLDPVLNDTLPLLYTLMGLHEGADPIAQMDPQIKLRRTVEAIKRIILRESLNQPLVVIFEDLHWIDSQTQELLDLLTESIANARVLLLFNYRPEYRHQWTNKSYYAQLRLDTLSEEGAAAMLSALLGEGVELAPLKRLVIERTEGNPFFIEEMVQALFDEGALVRNGAIKVTHSLSQVRLPATVQGILAARIDRLPAEQKDLLQILSVMGRESAMALIRQVSSTEEAQLERMLAGLQAADFIYEQPALSDIEYAFKHALTQEVAYNSMLIERRKLLHGRAGAAIEALYADRLDDYLSDLARHYQRSTNIEKALEYLGRAGQQAIQRSSHAEAIELFTSALELLQALPEAPPRLEQELALRLGLGAAMSPVKGWSAPELGEAFARARELCQQIGETPHLFQALCGLWAYYDVRGEMEPTLELAKQLLSIAQSAEDAALLPAAHHAMGQTLFWGQLIPAQTHLELCCSLYNPARYPLHAVRYFGCDIAVHSLAFLWPALRDLGFPDEGVDRVERAVALSRELAHSFSLCLALFGSSVVHCFRGEAAAASNFADAMFHLAHDQGFRGFLDMAIAQRGVVLIASGHAEEGISQLREGLDHSEGGFEVMRTFFLAYLAEGYGLVGRVDEGFAALAEAMALVESTGVCVYEAELYRIKGELTLKQPEAGSNSKVQEDAETYFRQALKVARLQSAKSWELRATMSLARLLAKQGRRGEARAMLAEIYGWFTEGFDTADLKDAKALLHELKR
jgi:class 3 adenylate cyclase/tetratricopeptide (TPR) repeat protein